MINFNLRFVDECEQLGGGVMDQLKWTNFAGWFREQREKYFRTKESVDVSRMRALEMVRDRIRKHFKEDVRWLKADLVVGPITTALKRGQMTAKEQMISDSDLRVRVVDISTDLANGKRVTAKCRISSSRAGEWLSQGSPEFYVDGKFIPDEEEESRPAGLLLPKISDTQDPLVITSSPAEEATEQKWFQHQW